MIMRGAPATLEPALRPAFLDAPDDAARLRVVIDQIASLTDTRPWPGTGTCATRRGDEEAGMAIVIIGAGLAGARAAETLRAEGYTGELVLVGAEREHPVRAAPAVQGLPAGQRRAELGVRA